MNLDPALRAVSVSEDVALMNTPNLMNISLPQRLGLDQDFIPQFSGQLSALWLHGGADHSDPCRTSTDAVFILHPAHSRLSALNEARCTWCC